MNARTPHRRDLGPVGLVAVLLLVLGACQVPPAGPQDLVVQTALGQPETLRYGMHARHVLDVHRPSAPARGALVFAHGGAWLTGDKAFVHPAIAQQVSRGWVVVSVNYRFADEVPLPAAVLDVRRAVSWVRAHGSHLGLTTSAPVVVAGHSAGGHLALMAAYGPRSLDPPGTPAHLLAVDGVVSLAGPTELMGWSTVQFDLFGSNAADLLNTAFGCARPPRQGALTCPMARLAAVSPLWSATAASPPTYLAYGTRDDLVPPWQGAGLHDRLAAHGASARVWLDVSDSSHALERLNATYLGIFLDRVADGTWRR